MRIALGLFLGYAVMFALVFLVDRFEDDAFQDAPYDDGEEKEQ